jgi:acetyl-CoA carboxylase carboxyl transferase subunit alpha
MKATAGGLYLDTCVLVSLFHNDSGYAAAEIWLAASSQQPLWISHWVLVEFASATALRMRSADLKEFGIVDSVIDEPPGGAHRDPRQMATRLKTFLVRTLRDLVGQPADKLVAERYEKFRRMGKFLEPEVA